MVSEKKKQTAKKLNQMIEEYSGIGIINMFKLPARQLHQLKEKLKEKAKIMMVKKRIIQLVLKDSELVGLIDYIQGEPAIFFTNENPFRIARIISKSKTNAPAKPGDIAPYDIVITAGPTPLPPGPAIGELQRLKIPSGVENEKIVVKKDTVVVKKDEEISTELSSLLLKLGIEPMEIDLNLTALHSKGTIFSKDILFIPQEEYVNKVKMACKDAFNLSINVNYYTQENINLLLSKANNEAVNLAIFANIITKDTIGSLFAKAQNEAKALKEKIDNK